MSIVSFLLKCLHSVLLPSLYIISLNKKSHSRLPLSKKKAFSQMKLHGSQKALLCPSCCCAALPTSHHCQRRKWIFFPLLATPGEVHYCVLGVLVLKGYCENCSKQNFQHQDARNRIQGWKHLPRVDVTAAPFSAGWYSSSPQLLDIAHSLTRGTKVAITDEPGRHKTASGCTKNFLPIRQGKNGSQFQTVGCRLHLCQQISMNCCGAP